ncbi:MAG: DegT/DnrJ/EryC1/StrS family aminotransferase [Acidobacteriota bacterium]
MADWIPHSRPTLDAIDGQAIETALFSCSTAERGIVQRFERAVAAYLGMAGGVATSSGTAALVCALKALDVGPGDEVVVPTYVCGAVWRAVRAVGAVPVLCDVGDNWCMRVESVRPCVTNRTRAIVVVHTFGIVAPIADICDLGVPVIEDCCQALGATDGGRMAGSCGDVCVLSFHATKLLTTAEGGMALSRAPGVVERLRAAAREHAEGLCQSLSDLQAALGLSQLSRYDGFLSRRRSLADVYLAELVDTTQCWPPGLRGRSIFFRFPILVEGGFGRIRAAFAADHIHVRRGVDVLLHRELGHARERFPAAERCFSETVCLPIYPTLSDEEQQRVILSARRILRHGVAAGTV